VSVFACFAPPGETRMPRPTSQPGPLNITWQGPVLEGHRSLDVAMQLSEIQARMPPPPVPVRRYDPPPFRPA